MKWDALLTDIKDYHLPITIGIFGVGSILQWFHHMDPTFVAFTATVLGAITGHAFSGISRDQGN